MSSTRFLNCNSKFKPNEMESDLPTDQVQAEVGRLRGFLPVGPEKSGSGNSFDKTCFQ